MVNTYEHFISLSGKKWSSSCSPRKIFRTKGGGGNHTPCRHSIFLFSPNSVIPYISTAYGKPLQYLTFNVGYQKLVIASVKKELGLAFKGNQKKVVEALEVKLKFISEPNYHETICGCSMCDPPSLC